MWIWHLVGPEIHLVGQVDSTSSCHSVGASCCTSRCCRVWERRTNYLWGLFAVCRGPSADEKGILGQDQSKAKQIMCVPRQRKLVVHLRRTYLKMCHLFGLLSQREDFLLFRYTQDCQINVRFGGWNIITLLLRKFICQIRVPCVGVFFISTTFSCNSGPTGANLCCSKSYQGLYIQTHYVYLMKVITGN